MPRYIDVEIFGTKLGAVVEASLRKDYNQFLMMEEAKSETAGLLRAIEILNSQPTADVQEVKHGRWIEKDSRYVHNFKCSVCNDVRFDIPTCMGKPLFNFCPNCGAKMNKEVKDNV